MLGYRIQTVYPSLDRRRLTKDEYEALIATGQRVSHMQKVLKVEDVHEILGNTFGSKRKCVIPKKVSRKIFGTDCPDLSETDCTGLPGTDCTDLSDLIIKMLLFSKECMLTVFEIAIPIANIRRRQVESVIQEVHDVLCSSPYFCQLEKDLWGIQESHKSQLQKKISRYPCWDIDDTAIGGSQEDSPLVSSDLNNERIDERTDSLPKPNITQPESKFRSVEKIMDVEIEEHIPVGVKEEIINLTEEADQKTETACCVDLTGNDEYNTGIEIDLTEDECESGRLILKVDSEKYVPQTSFTADVIAEKVECPLCNLSFCNHEEMGVHFATHNSTDRRLT